MNKLIYSKEFWIIGICVLGTYLTGLAQVQTKITLGAKDVYSIGDKIEMTIWITTLSETCLDGMEQIKLFKSGIDISKQSDWKELKRGFWQKDITLILTGNKKGFGMLTVMRKSDKQSFSFQERFDFIK